MKQEHIDFIKQFQGQIKAIIEERMQDYLNKIVDEPDAQRREVLCLMVKEFRIALVAINNLNKQDLKSKNEKPTEDYTGI